MWVPLVHSRLWTLDGEARCEHATVRCIAAILPTFHTPSAIITKHTVHMLAHLSICGSRDATNCSCANGMKASSRAYIRLKRHRCAPPWAARSWA